MNKRSNKGESNMKKSIVFIIAVSLATGFAGQDTPADPCNPNPVYYDQVYSFDCMPSKKKDKENEMVARTAYLLEQVNILKAQIEYQQATIQEMDRKLKICSPDCYGKENW